MRISSTQMPTKKVTLFWLTAHDVAMALTIYSYHLVTWRLPFGGRTVVYACFVITNEQVAFRKLKGLTLVLPVVFGLASLLDNATLSF